VVARYRRVKGDREDRELFVGINRPFDFGKFAALEYRSNRLTNLLSARVSKSRSLRPGWGYDLNLGIESGDSSAFLAAEYGGAHGVYSAAYRRIKGQDAYRLGTTGAVSWTRGQVFFSRPVGSSFALVEVEDLGGVDVMLNNQLIGTTSKDGRLLVPHLNPYYGNRLAINDRDIPVNYEIPRLEQVIATPFRGDGTVSFKVRTLQAFTGVLNIVNGNQARPAEYWGLRYSVNGEVKETVIGRSGVFYFENTPAGPLTVDIFSGEQNCQLTLEIPDTPEIHVDLGESNCELTN
jgi:outer membrane usher protein